MLKTLVGTSVIVMSKLHVMSKSEVHFSQLLKSNTLQSFGIQTN